MSLYSAEQSLGFASCRRFGRELQMAWATVEPYNALQSDEKFSKLAEAYDVIDRVRTLCAYKMGREA